MELIIKEITFEAAHYIPSHPKCGTIHGHTYTIEDLMIQGQVNDEGMVVDFGKIKEYFEQQWDHSFIVPKSEYLEIKDTLDKIGLGSGLTIIDGIPTVENIAKSIQADLEEMLNIKSVCFTLYEGKNQGVMVL